MGRAGDGSGVNPRSETGQPPTPHPGPQPPAHAVPPTRCQPPPLSIETHPACNQHVTSNPHCRKLPSPSAILKSRIMHHAPARRPHSIAQSQPFHFQDFSIQTISNQELTPPPPAKPIRMRALPPKYGWGWVARTRAKKRTPSPSPPPANILYLFAHLDPISINKSTTYKIGTSKIQPGNSRISPGNSPKSVAHDE